MSKIKEEIEKQNFIGKVTNDKIAAIKTLQELELVLKYKDAEMVVFNFKSGIVVTIVEGLVEIKRNGPSIILRLKKPEFRGAIRTYYSGGENTPNLNSISFNISELNYEGVCESIPEEEIVAVKFNINACKLRIQLADEELEKTEKMTAMDLIMPTTMGQA